MNVKNSYRLYTLTKVKRKNKSTKTSGKTTFKQMYQHQ